jgi:hypothetical protein
VRSTTRVAATKFTRKVAAKAVMSCMCGDKVRFTAAAECVHAHQGQVK